MATLLPAQKAIPIGLDPLDMPGEGGRAYQINIDFTATGAPLQSFTIDNHTTGLKSIQTAFIDNSNNSASTVIQVQGANQKLTCPPYSQGFFPILALGPSLNLTAQSAGDVYVPVTFLNVPMPLGIWNVQNPGLVQGTIPVSGTIAAGPTLGAYGNFSGAIAVANTSQLLAAANGQRKRIFIQNPTSATGQGIAAAEPLFVNFGAAAGVDDGNSFELQPGAALDTGLGPLSSEQINVVAATAGHRFIARIM